jgi:hypothetical protein
VTKPQTTPKDTEGKQPGVKANTELDKTAAKENKKKKPGRRKQRYQATSNN